jgi:hypothetical protein
LRPFHKNHDSKAHYFANMKLIYNIFASYQAGPQPERPNDIDIRQAERLI